MQKARQHVNMSTVPPRDLAVAMVTQGRQVEAFHNYYTVN
jgi:hypothetical protein